MEFKNSKTAKRRRYKSRYHSPHNYKTKRSKSENRAAILVAIATFLVIASLVLIFTFGDSIYAFVDGVFHPPVSTPDETAPPATVAPSGPAPSEVPTQIATTAPTQPPTQAPTQPPVQQSAEFEALINASGLNSAALTGSQMIFVRSAGTSALVYTYEKNEGGLWVQKFSPISGFVGTGGVAPFVGANDTGITPAGTYRIEYAMGINGNPGTKLTYYQITSEMVWVTDPTDANYNRWLRSTDTTIKGQWLREYTLSYPYALIFDYNRSTVDTAQGCQKFLHVSTAPTPKGGVGIPQADLQNILLWLDPNANATISIF